MSVAQRCLSMVKGSERFVFRYPEGREAELLSSLVALANDPETDFDWFDAAVLSYQMGQQLSGQLTTVSPVEDA
jgi:hypothetical protein